MKAAELTAESQFRYTPDMKRDAAGSSQTRLAASHQRSWLWGRHAVMEALAARRWPVLELLGSDDLQDEQLSELQSLAAGSGLVVDVVPAKRIEQLCHAPDHQGVLARMGEFPCGTADELLSQVRTRPAGNGLPALIVVCDRIQDAHNFGAILRCCDAMAVDAVVVGSTEQCRVTPHVARASAGAVNSQRIFRVPDLPGICRDLAATGITLVAATEKSDESLWTSGIAGAAAVVIGSEAAGIAPALLDACELCVRIPMLGRGSSLNAAVAAGIVLSEIRRQQTSEAR
jgi:23S rRNA (guanosine2251-2'-O)-methyltransferase